MRLFACIPVPPRLTAQLQRIQKGVSGARWRPPEYFHITLGFFGDITDDQAEDLDRELASRDSAGFELSLKGAGHFGQNPPHALWMGVGDSEPLRALARHVRNSARRAGVEMERRDYRPHLTLAYLRETVVIERVIRFEQTHARFESQPFFVDQYQMWSSHRRKTGPNLYRVEATYPLLGTR